MAQLNVASNTLKFTISEISKLTAVRSPEILLHGIPWEVEVRMCEKEERKWLAIYLYCTKKGDQPNWAATACASIKFLPFNVDHQVLRLDIPPYVYHNLDRALGAYTQNKWDDLLTKYVKDDTIQMEVNIEAEDPNSLSCSMPKFECIDKSCESSCQATFELVGRS